MSDLLSDPSAIILAHAVGGAASGAAKHLTESILQSGKAWLSSRFKDHQQKAVEKAGANSGAFIERLALKVDRLEQEHQLDRSIIDRALEEPSFGVLLQNALIGSAQTENGEKHDLLASIVAARLTVSTESVLAVASQMASSAVAHCSPAQLRFLGFCASTTLRWQRLDGEIFESKDQMMAECQPWFETRFGPYVELQVSHIDILHLESVSCLSLGYVGHALESILSANWSAGAFKLTAEDVMTFAVGESMFRIWKDRAHNTHLTSIGSLIGILVAQIVFAEPTRQTFPRIGRIELRRSQFVTFQWIGAAGTIRVVI